MIVGGRNTCFGATFLALGGFKKAFQRHYRPNRGMQGLLVLYLSKTGLDIGALFFFWWRLGPSVWGVFGGGISL